ncbi:MAG TPA: hypothetical protein VFW27_33275, partial [Actinoplanes sp.]|nr:hypothetical protein [Actinoplanes sp.]
SVQIVDQRGDNLPRHNDSRVNPDQPRPVLLVTGFRRNSSGQNSQLFRSVAGPLFKWRDRHSEGNGPGKTGWQAGTGIA